MKEPSDIPPGKEDQRAKPGAVRRNRVAAAFFILSIIMVLLGLLGLVGSGGDYLVAAIGVSGILVGVLLFGMAEAIDYLSGIANFAQLAYHQNEELISLLDALHEGTNETNRALQWIVDFYAGEPAAPAQTELDAREEQASSVIR